MRPMPNKKIVGHRVNTVPELCLPPEERDINPDGLFVFHRNGVVLQAICGVGEGWEHVSVVANEFHNGRARQRCPTWDEMCWIKRQFWLPEEVVVQYHPAESQHVNLHEHCLHLWRPIGVELPCPPKEMVG